MIVNPGGIAIYVLLSVIFILVLPFVFVPSLLDGELAILAHLLHVGVGFA